MQDYLVFGGGWGGEVKEDEDNLDVKKGFVRSAVIAAGGADIAPSLTGRYELNVYVFHNTENNLRYNVAADVLPDSEDIIDAIKANNPRPVPARKAGY
ncbi:hypothetical protein ACU62P_14645 [Klebsiella aerogenes]